jgi:hypothetical protein
MESGNSTPNSEKSIDFSADNIQTTDNTTDNLGVNSADNLGINSAELSAMDSPSSVYSEKKAFYDSKKVYFAPPTCPIKRMNSLLNKITDRTFQRISDEMLLVNLLENPTSEDAIPEDKDKMLPVIQTFIANVCQPACGVEIMKVYAKSFCKLKDNWKGRQGRILTELMMAELSKFFLEYSKTPTCGDEEQDVKIRNKCFKLCTFVALLYSEGAVGLRLVIAILQSFFKNDKLSLEVFCKLFAACQEKLMNDETFKSKVFAKYKNFLEENSKSESQEAMHKFMCLNILDSLK